MHKHTQLNANYAAVLQTAFTRGLGRPKTGIFVSSSYLALSFFVSLYLVSFFVLLLLPCSTKNAVHFTVSVYLLSSLEQLFQLNGNLLTFSLNENKLKNRRKQKCFCGLANVSNFVRSDFQRVVNYKVGRGSSRVSECVFWLSLIVRFYIVWLYKRQ